LGIPLLKAASEACNGYLLIESKPNVGTRLEVAFQRDHIDRMPLGDISGTILTLVIAYPDIHWLFKYRAALAINIDPVDFLFDDKPIKDELQNIPLCDPTVLKFIRGYIEDGVTSVQNAIACLEDQSISFILPT
jgi:hypothetical protein